MRFDPEASHGANAGLAIARKRLESIKLKHPSASIADIWTLAGVVAIQEMGGPQIAWRPGRSDAPNAKACPPDGGLPDASKGASHLRKIFGRMLVCGMWAGARFLHLPARFLLLFALPPRHAWCVHSTCRPRWPAGVCISPSMRQHPDEALDLTHHLPDQRALEPTLWDEADA
jgi:hypothetical protein